MLDMIIREPDWACIAADHTERAAAQRMLANRAITAKIRQMALNAATDSDRLAREARRIGRAAVDASSGASPPEER